MIREGMIKLLQLCVDFFVEGRTSAWKEFPVPSGWIVYVEKIYLFKLHPTIYRRFNSILTLLIRDSI